MALVTGQNVADALQLTYADDTAGFNQAASAAQLTVGNLLTATALAAENAACKEAALQVGIEIYQARTSVGGQIVSVDFTPGPYRLSVWLIRRVYALIGPYMNPAGMVG
jgi:hypothetical protein